MPIKQVASSCIHGLEQPHWVWLRGTQTGHRLGSALTRIPNRVFLGIVHQVIFRPSLQVQNIVKRGTLDIMAREQRVGCCCHLPPSHAVRYQVVAAQLDDRALARSNVQSHLNDVVVSNREQSWNASHALTTSRSGWLGSGARARDDFCACSFAASWPEFGLVDLTPRSCACDQQLSSSFSQVQPVCTHLSLSSLRCFCCCRPCVRPRALCLPWNRRCC